MFLLLYLKREKEREREIYMIWAEWIIYHGVSDNHINNTFFFGGIFLSPAFTQLTSVDFSTRRLARLGFLIKY